MTSLKRSTGTGSSTTTLANKVYVRSTKSGKVQKIVREIYLRDDIPCSSRLCTPCASLGVKDYRDQGELVLSGCGRYMLTLIAVAPPVLSDRPTTTKKFPDGHYLVPDTNAFLTGMDLFEVEDAFRDVVVLQTVLEEVKNRSLPLYHRLIALTKNDDKRFYVFFNEFRRETYVERQHGESINDRNDRAVREAVKWYRKHLEASLQKKKAKCPAIIMVSDDRDNLRKASADNIIGLSRKSSPCSGKHPLITWQSSQGLRLRSRECRQAS
jgi:exosome complex exonuclease DIS3/RRP44